MSKDKKTNEINKSMSRDKFKLVLSICALLFAVIWSVLWLLFPMEWFALFCNNAIGSNILLILLASVISMPMIYIFSKITKTDLPIVKSLIVNIISLVAVDFIYSIHYFERFYIVVIAVLIFCGINVWVFGFSKFKNEGIKLIPIKKQPVLTILWAVLYSVILVVLDILLFRLMLSIFIK